MAERIKDEVDHFEFPSHHPSFRASEWAKIYTDRAKEELGIGKKEI